MRQHPEGKTNICLKSVKKKHSQEVTCRILANNRPLYTDLEDVVLFLLAEAEDVEGLVGELHVLLVVDGLHAHLRWKLNRKLMS